MNYRVQYSNEARDALRALEKASPERLRDFHRRMGQVARNPYGFGNPVDGIEDRRQAVVAGTVTLYWISRSVLTISVVKVVHTG